MGGDAGGDGGQLRTECAAPGATRLDPDPKGTHEKVYRSKHRSNFWFRTAAQRKPLKSLARPKRLERLPPKSTAPGISSSHIAMGDRPVWPRAQRAKIGGCRFCSCWGCWGRAITPPNRRSTNAAERRIIRRPHGRDPRSRLAGSQAARFTRARSGQGRTRQIGP
jgi:hypothetical protein